MSTISTHKLPNVIEPSKFILEDFEIIAFEREDELDYYSYWHDSFRGKSFDHLLPHKHKPKQQAAQQQPRRQRPQQQQQQPAPLAQQQPHSPRPKHEPECDLDEDDDDDDDDGGEDEVEQGDERKVERATLKEPSPRKERSEISHRQARTSRVADDYQPERDLAQEGAESERLQTVNQQFHDGKVVMKYKLTKLYNKLRGRQMRRNIVLERLKNKRLKSEIAKCQLNPWLAYTALQALRLPDSNISQLSTIAITHNPRFISIPSTQVIDTSKPTPATKKKRSRSKKSQKSQAQPPAPQPAPMHYVYLDPNDIVTYSNRICPQQIVGYKERSLVLPQIVSSKKSSAASYDAYEIMEVLVNSDKTNVTITRNANRPAPAGTSVYSHSINHNQKHPSIVSTQLHLQARSYLDTLARMYKEEAERISGEEEKMDNEPPIEEQVSKYIKLDNI